ncbi:HD domain-containing protein [Caproicibacter sp.]|uniref:HD domain-containing protein n=1 Tax=Caproicibacter sp. TaxID=2814884 RepID=UPI003989A3BF
MERGIPDRDTAERMLTEAERLNPGPWVRHSRNVALAAKNIAVCCPSMDAESAFVMGLLHDIGRREGPHGMRHVLDGYRYLASLGYEKAAQICLTHSFPNGDLDEGQGKWDVSKEEYAFLKEYLASARYDDYDRLIQLCDALGDASGFCLIEKRLVDVAVRNGVGPKTMRKWKEYFKMKDLFEARIHKVIYEVLPGVLENTFGMSQNN